MFGASGDLPAREMLADMLIDQKRPEQALVKYEAELKIDPGRFDSQYGAGRAAQMLKLSNKANTYFDQLVKRCVGTDSSRPELTYARGFLSTVAKRNWIRHRAL